MSNVKKSALAGACLTLFLASCQPNEPDAVATQQQAPVPADLVRYVSPEASARAAGDKQKYIVTLKSYDGLVPLFPIQDSKYEARVSSMRKQLGSAVGITMAQRAEEIYVTALNGFAISLTSEEAASLRRLPVVESVEADQVIQLNVAPGDGVSAQAQETPWGITRIGGAVDYTGTGVAWVIDTGIDLDHPDLNVSQTRGRNFVRSGATPDDDNGHGTHVAGTIAAKNNGLGVIGVAAGATVIPVKVLAANGSGTYSAIIAGVDFVAANGRAGDVCNMSLGGSTSTALDNAVRNAATRGVRFVLAAGNSSTNANTFSPARVNGTNIFTVSAFDINNRFASFSNFANPPIDASAPGVSVRSTYKNGGYASLSGTSMAAPHVAGILLVNNGTLNFNGTVTGDRDGTPDKRAIR